MPDLLPWAEFIWKVIDEGSKPIAFLALIVCAAQAYTIYRLVRQQIADRDETIKVLREESKATKDTDNKLLAEMGSLVALHRQTVLQVVDDRGRAPRDRR